MRALALAATAVVALVVPSSASASKPSKGKVSAASIRWCKKHPTCIKRVHRRIWARIASSTKPVLDAIASCESGMNPAALSPGGKFRGLFQFDHQTWTANGGSGDPAAASVSEQYRIAAILYQRRGRQPWPVCGQRA